MSWIIVVNMEFYPYVNGEYDTYEEAKKEYDTMSVEEFADTYLAEVKEKK